MISLHLLRFNINFKLAQQGSRIILIYGSEEEQTSNTRFISRKIFFFWKSFRNVIS